jgi:hypothetical protein
LRSRQDPHLEAARTILTGFRRVKKPSQALIP